MDQRQHPSLLRLFVLLEVESVNNLAYIFARIWSKPAHQLLDGLPEKLE